MGLLTFISAIICKLLPVHSVYVSLPCSDVTSRPINVVFIFVDSSTRFIYLFFLVHPCTGTEALYRPYGP
jgi:hypothetical protein